MSKLRGLNGLFQGPVFKFFTGTICDHAAPTDSRIGITRKIENPNIIKNRNQFYNKESENEIEKSEKDTDIYTCEKKSEIDTKTIKNHFWRSEATKSSDHQIMRNRCGIVELRKRLQLSKLFFFQKLQKICSRMCSRNCGAKNIEEKENENDDNRKGANWFSDSKICSNSDKDDSEQKIPYITKGIQQNHHSSISNKKEENNNQRRSKREGNNNNTMGLQCTIAWLLTMLLLTTKPVMGAEARTKRKREDFSFRHIGSTVHALSYGSLRLNLDLTDIVESVQQLEVQVQSAKEDFTRYWQNSTQFDRDFIRLDDTMSQMDRLTLRAKEAHQRLGFFQKLKSRLFNKKAKARKKRAVFTVLITIGALAVGALAATIYGQYNNQEVADLAKKDDIISRSAKSIGDQVLTNTGKLNEITTVVQELGNFTKNFDFAIRAQEAINIIQNSIDRVERRLMGISDIIGSMANKRVSPVALEALDLEEVAEQLETEANMKGFIPLINFGVDLLQCDSSFIATDNGYAILIHIPVARPETMMQLYQISRMPVHMHGKMHLTVHTEADIIGINEESKLFTTMTATDLAACNEVSGFYFCQNQNVALKAKRLKHKNQPMCLHALFMQDYETVKNTCEWDISLMEASAQQLSPRKFITFNKEPHKARVHCPQSDLQTQATFTAQGVAITEVPPDCFVETEDYLLYGSDRSISREWDVSWSWPHDYEELTQGINFTAVESMISTDLTPISNKSRFALTEALAALQDVIDQAPLSASTTSWMAMVSTPTGLIVIVIIAYLCMKTRSTGQGQEQRQRGGTGTRTDINIVTNPTPTQSSQDAPPAYPTAPQDQDRAKSILTSMMQ